MQSSIIDFAAQSLKSTVRRIGTKVDEGICELIDIRGRDALPPLLSVDGAHSVADCASSDVALWDEATLCVAPRAASLESAVGPMQEVADRWLTG